MWLLSRLPQQIFFQDFFRDMDKYVATIKIQDAIFDDLVVIKNQKEKNKQHLPHLKGAKNSVDNISTAGLRWKKRRVEEADK